uniref:RING-type domain-containing protein n=1 Tax=Euplotes harpa TaxID=151035 RepID=A0A7S3NDZ7_9SPIT|mmetsp:Transcript_41246/g.47515  ORF Transcript_41246/g.47515 Transcript_41246/m.47515 type:complete len:154 (+) Transcript_41246:688-1149(+)
MVLQLGTYFLIFSKTGISITFSFIHMYYMMRNFRFLFIWIKEFENFRTFHKYRRMISSKFTLVVMDTQKEECSICLNTLVSARELSCGHHFHLLCLLTLIKNGDKRCPVCRRSFDQQRNRQNVDEQLANNRAVEAAPVRRNLNQINFYGLEDD